MPQVDTTADKQHLRALLDALPSDWFEKEQLVLNRVKCLGCGAILTSTHVHELVRCKFPNQYQVESEQQPEL